MRRYCNGGIDTLLIKINFHCVQISSTSSWSITITVGASRNLFQTFPQALNHEIDDLHRGLLAYFFFLSFFHYQWQAEVLPHWLPTSSPPPNVTLPLFDRVLEKNNTCWTLWTLQHCDTFGRFHLITLGIWPMKWISILKWMLNHSTSILKY